MITLNLCDSKWKLKYFDELNEETLDQELENQEGWISSAVPSNVQEYFCGDNPFYSDNLTKLLWTEEKIWVYTAGFNIDLIMGKKYFLRFKGVDYFSRIYLNGSKLEEHEGMYSDIILGISGSIRTGYNRLAVILSVPEETRKRESMNKRLKCQSQYGWDFAPRLLTMGIWGEVLIEEYEEYRLGDFQVKTFVSGLQALIEVKGDISGIMDAAGKKECSIIVHFDGRDYMAAVIGKKFCASIPMDNPRLWFPTGCGEPNLYDMKLGLYNEDSVCIDVREFKVGIREISSVHCPGQKIYHTPLKFKVNGKEIFLKGVNWTPAEVFPAKINKERYRQLLELVKDANCNTIRVWGGGLVEKEDFYNLCDEMGLLVFQEFPMACILPSREEDYMVLLESECTAIIKKLRNHPSILLWCGGNELYVDWSPVKGDTELHRSLTGKVRNIIPGFDEETYYAGAKQYNEPALRLLDRICKLEDGTRPFHISSPLEGEGEVHGPWTYDLTIGDERYQLYSNFYRFWNESNANMYSEVGCNAVTNIETYKRIIPVSEQWPLDPQSDSLRYHKAFDAAWTQDTWITCGIVEDLFGKLSSLDEFVWANQYIQAESLRYLLQEIQRKHPSTSGSIIWCFNEPWPNAASSSIIDYYGNPKMSYYYVQKAFSPVLASLRYNSLLLNGSFEGELWYHNIGGDNHENYNVQISIIDDEGNILFGKQYKCVHHGKLDDLNIRVEKKGIIYAKVFVVNCDNCVYEDCYTFVNKLDNMGILLNKSKRMV